MDLRSYYESYWRRRLAEPGDRAPVRDSVPRSLVRYSQYGSVANLIPAGSRLLDLGCGEGNVTELYGRVSGRPAVGLDVSAAAVERARERGVDARVADVGCGGGSLSAG